MFKDKDRTPVAQDLFTMCTKCRMELKHVVVSHNMDGRVGRVKCHTCGSEHKYHPDKKKTPVRTTDRVMRTRAKKTDPRRDFQELFEKFREKDPVPYSISGSFSAEDVIDHKTFGKGIVIRVSHQKMEVAFSEGPRVLACNR
jgi:hypothetical protein